MVVETTNIFKEGKFTQTLKAQKDVLSQNPISTAKEGQKSTAGNAPADPVQNFEQASGYAFGA